MTATSPDHPPGRPGPAWPWLVALTAAGMLLAALPHLIQAARTGDPAYIADSDGLLYLAWSRDAVRKGSWAMVDAVHERSGPMMHPWLLFVPPARLAHALGLGMTGLGIVWRLLGGAGLALGLYAATRPLARTPRGAAALAAFLLFDAGLLSGQLVQRDGEVLLSLIRGTGRFLREAPPQIMPYLRVPPPALAIPFLLAHFALARRSRERGTVGSAIAAGASLGLLFHAYIYFATGAAAGALLAWLIDPGGRRSYGLILVVGAAVGLPAVLAGASIKASTSADWLHRTDKFVAVDRLDPAQLRLPKVLILEWLAAAWLVFRSRRDLIHLWACTGAGLALANHQVVTGLDIENFHWSQSFGLAFSLLLALLALPALGRRWRVAAALLAIQVPMGLGLRAVESVGVAESNAYLAIYRGWRAEGLSIPPGAVVSGREKLLEVLAAFEDLIPLDTRLVAFSSAATDDERNARRALNLYLSSGSVAEARAEIDRGVHADDAMKADQRARLDAIGRDPEAAIGGLGPIFLLLPSGRTPPGLGGRARREAEGRTMSLWRLGPDAPGADAAGPDRGGPRAGNRDL